MGFFHKNFAGFKLSLYIVCNLGAFANANQVISFYPTGSVKQVQQVTVRFSEDTVAMGSPLSKNDPFEIECNLLKTKRTGHSTENGNHSVNIPYATRWADSKNWVLDFEKPLNSGIRCSFKINSKFRDLSGQSVRADENYTFSTSGPAVLGVQPSFGQIEPDQYFVVLVDGPLDLKSVEEKSYFEVEGLPDKVKVNLVGGKDRDIVIKAAIKDSWSWSKYREIINQNPSKNISNIQELDGFLVVSAKRRFPDGARVVFHWPEGILSKSGLPVEEPQVFSFEVIKPFQAQFSCERSAPERPCNPILDMSLFFSNSVSRSSLAGARLESSDGQIWYPSELENKDQKTKSQVTNSPVKNHLEETLSNLFSLKSGGLNSSKKSSQFDDRPIQNLTFKAPFPASKKFKLILPSKIKDDLGRALENQNKYPLAVATDEYSPLIKFSASFGILELNADPILPVSVRNVEKNLQIQQISIEGKSLNLSSQSQISEVIKWYQRVSSKAENYHSRNTSLLSSSQGSNFKIPKPLPEKDFELVGIPLKKPGFYVIEMASPRLGKALTNAGPMFVATSALVTDMAVHFKKGRESSLIWVTQLSSGRPVENAQISIMNSSGKEIASGFTNNEGLVKLGPIKYPCDIGSEGKSSSEEVNEVIEGDRCEVFAFAKKNDDMSFASSNWSKGIEMYRFNFSSEYFSNQWGPSIAHTILSRVAAQPGDLIQMKHVFRDYTSNGFKMMKESKVPRRVFVVHEGSQKVYTLPIDINKKTGTATSQMTLPKNAPLGRYSIYLSNSEKVSEMTGDAMGSFDWSSKETGSFIVSEYRLPLMKADVKIKGEPLVNPREVKVDLSASYLSGGPAKKLKLKLRSSLEPGQFVPDIPGGSDFNFFSAPLKEGVNNSENHLGAEESFLKVNDLILNEDGGLLTQIDKIPRINKIQQLSVEMDYLDPNGEIKTSRSHVQLFPADNVIGLKTDSWYAEPGKIKVMGVITNIAGKPQNNKLFIVEAFLTNYMTHRKRLVGGFYSYDSMTEVINLGKVCEGKSDQMGRFKCEPKGLPPGSITLQAKTLDDKDRATYASVNMSIYKEGADAWWTPSDSDRIDLIPEKNRYEPGETAKLIVRSPYMTSTVLVTVEREGILYSYVKEIRRDNPVIEIPIKGNYAPNVFVSALVIRGRVGEPKPTSLLDLSRPAMKMGMAELKVGWKAHELMVSVKSDKIKYQTKEKVKVKVQVKTAMGERLPSDSEVALAVVDESLLRLKENSSWKILDAMMGERRSAVETSSGQNQVIGRRHFGSKAKEPGGGGGFSSADGREFFEPVLFWQPSLKINSIGEAEAEFNLNDSITSFRVVAVAQGGEDLFGSGQTSIQATKDLIIYSGFAPLVREGDQIKNSLTLRNTTDKEMKIDLDVSAKELNSLPQIPRIDLGPSEAKTIEIPITVPMGIKELSFKMIARDILNNKKDILATKVKVEPAIPTRVLQATLFQLDKTFQIPVKQPGDAIVGKGGLRYSARASLVSGMEGVRSYMNDYPYSCLEQKFSKAIVLENQAEVQRLINDLPAFLDSDGLLKFFPSSDCGSPLLSRYILNILNENSYSIPEMTRNRILEGMSLFIEGKTKCRSWWGELSPSHMANEQKLLVMESLSRFGSFKNGFLSTIQMTPNLWKNETVISWYQLLKRQKDIPNQPELLRQAANILRSRVNFQGSIMNLQNELNGDSKWSLLTSNDQEALGVFGLSIDEPDWSDDVGRMARGVVARMRLGRWDTTMANAWAVTNLRRFSLKFEKEKISGETQFLANGIDEKINWQSHPQGDSRLLSWPNGSHDAAIPVKINHLGGGKPWIHFETISAIPIKAPLDLGYRVTKKITPVTQSQPGVWKIGDVVEIEITVVAKASQPWVVIRDPIPAGASHLGIGLDGASNILNRFPVSQKNQDEIRNWPTEYEEKSQSQFISYAAYLPKGTYRTSYRVRLNSAGEFKLPPSRIEAMYSPESFGEIPNENWTVSK